MINNFYSPAGRSVLGNTEVLEAILKTLLILPSAMECLINSFSLVWLNFSASDQNISPVQNLSFIPDKFDEDNNLFSDQNELKLMVAVYSSV